MFYLALCVSVHCLGSTRFEERLACWPRHTLCHVMIVCVVVIVLSRMTTVMHGEVSVRNKRLTSLLEKVSHV